MNEETSRVDRTVDRATDVVADKLAEAKPRLRGWLHAGSVPLMAVALVVLVVRSPTALTRVGSTIYAVSALLLFTVSAVYHRGTWQPRMWAFWRRFDHANIYVFIAGTYTPFAFLYLRGEDRAWLLTTVWGCAAVGLAVRIGWTRAPRWLFAPLYIALGWVAVLFVPQVAHGSQYFPGWVNLTALTLVAAGGVLYTIGGIVYAARRPNPSPAWFGFHEVFHLSTVLAFVAHYVAVSAVTYSLR